ncbi:DNA cytosine methyltransferase [Holzapfeliella sp. JNUCC 80]
MPYAIDMFSGAGGFSEGILQAGFDIVFSSDKSSMAKETYVNRHKQLGIRQGIDTYFELSDIQELTSDTIFEKINSLKYEKKFKPGDIDVIFGGPPCQGFSRLGKRDSNDPRNRLFYEYIRIINDVKPKYVVMENVTGILDMNLLNFSSITNHIYKGQNLVPYILRKELQSIGYTVLDIKVLNAADYGVPQKRNRVIFLAYRNDVYPIKYPEPTESIPVSIRDAFGDLYKESPYDYSTVYSKQSVNGRTLKKDGCPLETSPLTNMEYSEHTKAVTQRFCIYGKGENKKKALRRIKTEGIDLFNKYPNLFFETLFQINSEHNKIVIKEVLFEFNVSDTILSESTLNYINKLLSEIYLANITNDGINFEKKISRLSKKIKVTTNKAFNIFKSMQKKLNQKISLHDFKNMTKAGNIDDNIANVIFTKKNIRSRLDYDDVAPTIVTLPDDYIHPYFNRILTVREMARLQSFDDSFEFLGKRTTGGSLRSQETPQFTQVGNAVPPLLAKAVAISALNAINKTKKTFNI